MSKLRVSIDVSNQPKSFRLTFERDISELTIRKKTLRNQLTGAVHAKVIQLECLLNTQKLESKSRFVAKLKQFNDSIHEKTSYSIWHSTLSARKLTMKHSGRIKLYDKFQRRMIREYKKYKLWTGDLEAYIVLYDICDQMSDVDSYYYKCPLLRFLSLDFNRFHKHRINTVLSISNPKLKMEPVPNLSELHRMGNFFLDMIAHSIKVNLTWSNPIIMNKMISSLDLWNEPRQGESDWMYREHLDCEMFFACHQTFIGYSLEKFTTNEKMFKWVSTVQGLPHKMNGFGFINKQRFVDYRHTHDWVVPMSLNQDNRIVKNYDNLFRLRSKRKRYTFKGDWFVNTFLGDSLKSNVKDAINYLSNKMTHGDADKVVSAVNGRLKMYPASSNEDNEYFHNVHSHKLMKMLLNVFSSTDQLLIVLIADLYVWLAEEQLDENIWLVQILASMEMWTWRLMHSSLEWYFRETKHRNLSKSFDPCTFAAVKHWAMMVTNIDRRYKVTSPDWHLHGAIFRQYKSLLNQENYSAFELMNMFQCLYHYGPCQEPSNEKTFWDKYTLCLGNIQHAFEKDYVATFKQRKWKGDLIIPPEMWDPKVLDALTISTIAIPDRKSEKLYLSSCTNALEAALRYISDDGCHDEDSKQTQLTPGNENNENKNNENNQNNNDNKNSRDQPPLPESPKNNNNDNKNSRAQPPLPRSPKNNNNDNKNTRAQSPLLEEKNKENTADYTSSTTTSVNESDTLGDLPFGGLYEPQNNAYDGGDEVKYEENFLIQAMLNNPFKKDYAPSSVGTVSVYGGFGFNLSDEENEMQTNYVNDLLPVNSISKVVIDEISDNIIFTRLRKRQLPLQFDVIGVHSGIHNVINWDNVADVKQLPWCSKQQFGIIVNNNEYYMTPDNNNILYHDQFNHIPSNVVKSNRNLDEIHLWQIQAIPMPNDKSFKVYDTPMGLFETISKAVDHMIGKGDLCAFLTSGLIDAKFANESEFIQFCHTDGVDYVRKFFPKLEVQNMVQYRDLTMEIMCLSSFDPIELEDNHGRAFVHGDATDISLLNKFHPAGCRVLLAGIIWMSLRKQQLINDNQKYTDFILYKNQLSQTNLWERHVITFPINDIFDKNNSMILRLKEWEMFEMVTSAQAIQTLRQMVDLSKDIVDDIILFTRRVDSMHDADEVNKRGGHWTANRPHKIYLRMSAMRKIMAIQQLKARSFVFLFWPALIDRIYGPKNSGSWRFINRESDITGDTYGLFMNEALGYVASDGGQKWAMKHGYELEIAKKPMQASFQLNCFFASLQRLKLAYLCLNSSRRNWFVRISNCIIVWIDIFNEIIDILENKQDILSSWRESLYNEAMCQKN